MEKEVHFLDSAPHIGGDWIRQYLTIMYFPRPSLLGVRVVIFCRRLRIVWYFFLRLQ